MDFTYFLTEAQTETFMQFVERGRREGWFMNAALGLRQLDMNVLCKMGLVSLVSMGRFQLTLAGEKLASELETK